MSSQYSLIRTHRGWKLDAGTLDAPSDRIAPAGAIRTLVNSHIREFKVLDETFLPPADLATLIKQFRTETARRDGYSARCLVGGDKWAERVELLDDQFEGATLRVHLLSPVRLKVGLMLMVGGVGARVGRAGAVRRCGAGGGPAHAAPLRIRKLGHRSHRGRGSAGRTVADRD